MCERHERPEPVDHAVDYALLSHEQRVDALAELQRRRAALDAAEQRLLHAMHADPLPNIDGTPAPDRQWVREHVACVQRIAPATAAGRLQDATELITRLPNTLRMLERGDITFGHVRRLVDAITVLPDTIVAKIERRVLTRAGQQSIAEFGAAVRRAVLALDTRTTEDRHQDALAERRVVFTPQPDGIIDLYAALPADGALALQARLQADAVRLRDLDKQAGISRSADQRRADALMALATVGAGTGTVAGGTGVRPAVNVTVALSTLLGVDEQPGELDGYGPIPAAVARALAFDPTGTWRRLLTDPAGRLVDVTSHTYRPPIPMARLVVLQQPRCCYPGCRRRAITCDLDHLVPWPTGATCAANLQPLCVRHHHVKHDAGWRPRKDPDGTTVWRAPTGHEYARPPDDLPVDTTTNPARRDTAVDSGGDEVDRPPF